MRTNWEIRRKSLTNAWHVAFACFLHQLSFLPLWRIELLFKDQTSLWQTTPVLNHLLEKGKYYLSGSSIPLDLFSIYWTLRYVEQDSFFVCFFRAVFSKSLNHVHLVLPRALWNKSYYCLATLCRYSSLCLNLPIVSKVALLTLVPVGVTVAKWGQSWVCEAFHSVHVWNCFLGELLDLRFEESVTRGNFLLPDG